MITAVYASRFATDSALFSMNSRRGSTSSPINVENSSSAATRSVAGSKPFKFDNKKRAEVLYHTRLTANQIEDEIRELREERAAVAKELEEVNAALRGK